MRETTGPQPKRGVRFHSLKTPQFDWFQVGVGMLRTSGPSKTQNTPGMQDNRRLPLQTRPPSIHSLPLCYACDTVYVNSLLVYLTLNVGFGL